MNRKRKICVVTGSRAEYGLLMYLMKEIDAADDLELQIIVTGMHLDPAFGLTYKQIISDGFLINHKVDILLSSDTAVAVSKSMGLGMIGFADAYEKLSPDLLLVLGDRFEIFSAVSAAAIAKIPVAHLHGGETTEGAYDEALRHSITKMSHIHFTSTEEYRGCVIQLGEQPKYVFNVGAIGIDNIKRIKLLSKDELEESISFKLGKRNLLVTFHPATLDNSPVEEQFSNLLSALNELEDTHVIFTKANTDNGGRSINKMIDDYVANNINKTIAFSSLGQRRYYSAMKYMDGVVGNSSSGIIEAPSFHVGTINIGERQAGRIRAKSVIDCESTSIEIKNAIDTLYTAEFNNMLKSTNNPYDANGTIENILDNVRLLPLSGLLKKTFYKL